MDKALAIVYLYWLAACYPGEKIGLIWDFAAAHKSAEVLEHAWSLNIVVCFIPAGLSSILQVCDLLVNKSLKQYFKKQYSSFKIRSDPGPGGKYAVHRDDILVWMEDGVNAFNESQMTKNGIANAFSKYGQDPRSQDNNNLMHHLSGLKENSIYMSLLDNQQAVDCV